MYIPGKVERKWPRVTDTLQGRIHETRVAQIVQPGQAPFTSLLVEQLPVFCQAQHLLGPGQVHIAGFDQYSRPGVDLYFQRKIDY